MSNTVGVKYVGAALPAISATVILFSTVASFPGAKYLQQMGLHRLLVTIDNDQAGTIRAYKSADRGVTWTRILADIAVAASAANTEGTVKDFLIEQYADFKLEWVNNGATAQTTFNVSMVIDESRNLAF